MSNEDKPYPMEIISENGCKWKACGRIFLRVEVVRKTGWKHEKGEEAEEDD